MVTKYFSWYFIQYDPKQMSKIRKPFLVALCKTSGLFYNHSYHHLVALRENAGRSRWLDFSASEVAASI